VNVDADHVGFGAKRLSFRAAAKIASSSAATMSNPLAANCLASSQPMPLDAPVTRASGQDEEASMHSALSADLAGRAAELAMRGHG
jgi:hypothetical protein